MNIMIIKEKENRIKEIVKELRENTTKEYKKQVPTDLLCLRIKLHDERIKLWREIEEEEILKKERFLQNGTRNRTIIQLTIDGEFVAKYSSMKEAGEITGLNTKSISDCCNKRTKSSNGFIWRYDY